MRDLLVQARQVQDFLDAMGWRSCIIGGIAVQRWGEPRLTRDVDITLLAGLGSEEQYVDAILMHFGSRIAEAREFALQNRVMLLKSAEGTEVDLALGALPFEERTVGRATGSEFYPGLTLRTCSAEDLIVMKAFAGRELDWADVKGIIARQGKALDWNNILAELRPLADLKETPEIVTHLERLRYRASGTG